MRWLALVLLAVAALSLLLFLPSDPPPVKPVPAPVAAPPPARELVDEDHRVALRAPSSDWALLDGEAVQALIEGAALGAHRGENFAALLVEPDPGGELEALARRVSADLRLEDRRAERFEVFQVAGREGFRARTRGRQGAVGYRFEHVFFRNAGHLYQLLCWAPAAEVPEPCAALASGLRVLPGPVKLRRPPPAPGPSAGPGWRAEEGRLEHVIHALRLDPQPGWLVRAGAAAVALHEDASLAILQPRRDLYAALVVHPRTAVTKVLEKRREGFAETQGLEPSGEAEANVLGPVRLARFTGSDGLTYLHGAVPHREGSLEILAWSRSGDAGAEAAILAGLTAVRPLTGAALEAAREALRRGPDPQILLAPTHVLRGGVFRDFERGFRWRKPDALWSVEATAESMRFRALESGLLGELRGVEGRLGEAHLRLASEAGKAVAGGLRSERVEAGRRTTILSRSEGERVYHMVVSGPEAAHDEGAIQAAWRGLEIDPSPPRTQEGGVFRDALHGVALRLPGAGWAFQDEGEPGRLEVAWRRDPQLVGLAVYHLPPGQEADFEETWIQGAGRGHAPKSRAREVFEGQPATRVDWAGHQALLVRAQGRIICLLMAPAMDGLKLELIDP